MLLEKLTGLHLVKNIPRILWNQKVHYRIQKCPPPVFTWARSILSIPPHSTSWRSTLILFYLLPAWVFSLVSFTQVSPTKTLYAPSQSPIRAIYFAHLIHFAMITRIIFCVQYRSLSSSLCNPSTVPITSFFLGPNIFLCTLFPQTIYLCSSLMWETNFTFMLPCIVIDLLSNNQPDALIIQTYYVIKFYMFRASSLPIIRSFLLYIRHWYMSYRFLMTASKQSQDGTHPSIHPSILTLLGSGHQKPAWNLPVPNVQ